MMKSTSQKEYSYVRARDNPYFDGIRRGEAAKGSSMFDFQEKLTSKNVIDRSSSDLGYIGSSLNFHDATHVTEDDIISPKSSPSDIVLEPVGRSLSGRWSTTLSPLVVYEQDPNVLNLHEENEPSTAVGEENESAANQNHELVSFGVQSSYCNVRNCRSQTDISDVPLPPSAALYYYGPSQLIQVVESCQSIEKLNLYLKSKRLDVNAGVPGRFLHAVMGPDVADVGSVCSTILYTFYLHLTHGGSNHLCTLPIINMKRAALDSHAHLQWLFHSSHIDPASFICIDEIDLSYYDLFGSLKLALLNCDKIPVEAEALKGALVEVFNCNKSDSSYSSVDSITIQQDASRCAVIAERFLQTSPELLTGKGFSRLLLAGILMDTENLSSPECTSKDKYMATLLINGGGRFGCNGLYQILKYKTYGSSNLHKVGDILRKEYKKWDRSGKKRESSRLQELNMGMSSIGMSIAQMLAHNSDSIQEIIHFQNLHNLSLLLVVSSYYDSHKKFKREILISAESEQLMKNLLQFLNSNAAQLPLKALGVSGLNEEMRVFEVEKVTSRKTIEGIMEEFGSASQAKEMYSYSMPHMVQT